MIKNNTTEIEMELLDFDNAFSLMQSEIDKALLASPFIVRQYMKHLLNGKGKYIRALSVLICALSEQNKINITAVKYASAIEILHLATLIHDDVIDDADTRRGILTLQKKYGKRTAVICGDYLLSKALNLIHSVSEKEKYIKLQMPNYIEKICLGELYQHINNNNFDLTQLGYFKIIAGKTAALFEASFYGGAILSDCDEKELINYKKLGRYMGMIFQLIDDCMDFEATESIAKKPVKSDFEQSVITLPLIYTLSEMPAFYKKIKTSKITRAELDEAVTKSGGIHYTREVAKKYYQKSMLIIESLSIQMEKKEQLIHLLNKTYRVF